MMSKPHTRLLASRPLPGFAFYAEQSNSSIHRKQYVATYAFMKVLRVNEMLLKRRG